MRKREPSLACHHHHHHRDVDIFPQFIPPNLGSQLPLHLHKILYNFEYVFPPLPPWQTIYDNASLLANAKLTNEPNELESNILSSSSTPILRYISILRALYNSFDSCYAASFNYSIIIFNMQIHQRGAGGDSQTDVATMYSPHFVEVKITKTKIKLCSQLENAKHQRQQQQEQY